MSQPADTLKMEFLTLGRGSVAKDGQTVSVHYTGRLTDGTKFDSSVDRNEPFEFVVGAGEVIGGWDAALGRMRIGDKVRLSVPPTLGYGVNGYPGAIPPNATLVFDVELLAVR